MYHLFRITFRGKDNELSLYLAHPYLNEIKKIADRLSETHGKVVEIRRIMEPLVFDK